jgi:hypothetical protein
MSYPRIGAEMDLLLGVQKEDEPKTREHEEDLHPWRVDSNENEPEITLRI